MVIFSMPSAQVFALLTGTALPLLVGLVTSARVSAGRKACLLAALSAISSVLTAVGDGLVQGVPVDVGVLLVTAVGIFLTGVGTHYGLWKPVGVSGAAQSALVKG